MPPITWATVQDEFNKLNKANVTASLEDLVDYVHRLIDSKPKGYSPADALELVETVRSVISQVEEGEPLEGVLAQARSVGYIQSYPTSPKTVININNQVNEAILEKTLEKLKANAPNPKLEVPVILLVMNKTQAVELDDETAFADLPQDFKETFKQDFDALRPMLDADWIERYGKKPEDWRPFTDTTESIKQRLNTMLNIIKQRKKYESQLVPKFVDIHTLNQEWGELVSLRQKGCIVIEDAISMRYPSIQREYRRSLLDAFNKTIIIRIVPRADALDCINQPMLTWVEKFEDLEFYKRREVGDDTCREIFKSLDFLGWFNTHVPSLIPKEEKVKNSVAGDIIGGGDQ